MGYKPGQPVHVISQNTAARVMRVEGKRVLCKVLSTRAEEWFPVSDLKFQRRVL
jgi:hypothetical protein